MKHESKKISQVLDLIGNTPLVKLNRIISNNNINLFAKLEFCNPSFSIKDRMVLHVITQAEKSGKLQPGMFIVEASSGNTASSVAMMAAIKGYKTIITTPDTTSDEKVKTARAYGAEVIICSSKAHVGDPEHYVTKAANIAKQKSPSFTLNQYDNQQNVEAHYLSTGPEIWEQTDGKITHLVACASTGGTVTGVSKYLKEQNPDIKVIVPDPPGSVYHSYSKTKEIVLENLSTKIEGAGKKYIPGCMNFDYIDEVIKVTDEEAFWACRQLATTEGLLIGGSGGAALATALKVTDHLKPSDVMVVIMADSGIKYLSKIFK
jgi:cystathionine beta-synthase